MKRSLGLCARDRYGSGADRQEMLDMDATAVRHRRHPRAGQHPSDDRRGGAGAGQGRRAAVHARRSSPPRGDRQGHAAVRLHAGAGADRGLRLGRDERDAGRPDADAGRGLPDPLAARRSRRDDLGLAQSLPRQRHQAVRPRRLQAVRRDRGRDRGADGRDARPTAWPAAADLGRAQPDRRRARPLHREPQEQLPARA